MSIGKRNLQLHNENRNESKDEVRPVVIEVGTDGVRALDSSEEGGRARGEGIAISDVELGGRPLGAGNGDGARGLPVQAASTIVQLYELELRLRADLPDHTHALPKGAAVLPQSSAVCSRDVQTAGVGRRLCRTPSSAARPASGPFPPRTRSEQPAPTGQLLLLNFSSRSLMPESFLASSESFLASSCNTASNSRNPLPQADPLRCPISRFSSSVCGVCVGPTYGLLRGDRFAVPAHYTCCAPALSTPRPPVLANVVTARHRSEVLHSSVTTPQDP